MSKIRIEIKDYPFPVSFDLVDFSLPPFKYGCPIRTEILINLVRGNPHLNKHPHVPEDYIVEEVITKNNKEIWIIGS